MIRNLILQLSSAHSLEKRASPILLVILFLIKKNKIVDDADKMRILHEIAKAVEGSDFVLHHVHSSWADADGVM